MLGPHPNADVALEIGLDAAAARLEACTEQLRRAQAVALDSIEIARVFVERELRVRIVRLRALHAAARGHERDDGSRSDGMGPMPAFSQCSHHQQCETKHPSPLRA
jgi:hypothetical protein